MGVRAKFKCNGILLTQQMVALPGITYNSEKRKYVDEKGNEHEGQPFRDVNLPTVTLNPVYAGSDASEEDKAFWSATPNGELKMQVTNADAAEFFELGETYYLDFSKAS